MNFSSQPVECPDCHKSDFLQPREPTDMDVVVCIHCEKSYVYGQLRSQQRTPYQRLRDALRKI